MPPNRANTLPVLDLRAISVLQTNSRREFAIDAISAPERHPPIK
jgi:hypothetical protein